MRTLFGILLVINLLLVGFLVYHFATVEHAQVQPAPLAGTADADSIKLYEQRVAELEQGAAELRQRLGGVNKSEWPAVHMRLVMLDQQIVALKSAVGLWKERAHAAGTSAEYHEVLNAYGKAGVLYMALGLDTLPSPAGKGEK
jgi:hypothetical protein